MDNETIQRHILDLLERVEKLDWKNTKAKKAAEKEKISWKNTTAKKAAEKAANDNDKK